MKPPYAVPTMAEIAATEPNGCTVVSTFSGGGGSSTGYRMAGFRIAWASEFVPEYAATYRANAAPGTVVDTRDIREVQPADILGAAGLAAGQADLMDGSPPCSSFSMAGKRERGWGKARAYEGIRQRTDDLFWEFARLVEGCQPKVFVAENVAGLVRGTAKGYFKQILARLTEAGYVVSARLLDAEWLGVPQRRERLFFVGVRRDLRAAPVFPSPLPYRYTVRDALGGDLAVIRNGRLVSAAQPCPTIQTHGNAYTYSELAAATGNRGVTHDPETGAGISLSRYAIGVQWEQTPPGGSHKQRFSLARAHPDMPLPAITRTGGDVSAASVAHWGECRKFTLAELRRLGGFPDDYVLTGTYSQRYSVIGRSVPPVMMRAVAETIRDRVLR